MSDTPDDASPDVLTSAAQGRLRTIVERLERLKEDAAAVKADEKEVFAEAKGEGYDVKILRKVLRIRGMDPAKRQEEDAILDLYLTALGEAPLFESAGVTVHVSTRSAPRGPGTGPGPVDAQALYDEAVALVRRDSKASVSYVQRRLQLGYNRAASLVELMEKNGVVTTADAAGKRTVLPWGRDDGGDEPQPAAVH
jgi:uncharacterized protein (UPF0335 family)